MSAMTSHHPVTASRPAIRTVNRPTSTVRLTRRGRVVVVMAGLAVVLLLGLFLSTGSAADDGPAPTRVVMVGEGDTLWAIASDAAGDGDVRDMIATIERINHLDGGMVTLGQRLRIPVGEG